MLSSIIYHSEHSHDNLFLRTELNLYIIFLTLELNDFFYHLFVCYFMELNIIFGYLENKTLLIQKFDLNYNQNLL